MNDFQNETISKEIEHFREANESVERTLDAFDLPLKILQFEYNLFTDIYVKVPLQSTVEASWFDRSQIRDEYFGITSPLIQDEEEN